MKLSKKQPKSGESNTLHKQQDQPNKKKNVLTVECEVNENIKEGGKVIGMKGVQVITYTYTNGNKAAETYRTEWKEDKKVETLQYEYPARAERFKIYKVKTGKKYNYPIQTTHSEGGIAIHGPGRSEGCIIASSAVRNDILNRIKGGETLYGEITNVIDIRPADQRSAAPIPYKKEKLSDQPKETQSVLWK